jgi:hypothetical protein
MDYTIISLFGIVAAEGGWYSSLTDKVKCQNFIEAAIDGLVSALCICLTWDRVHFSCVLRSLPGDSFVDHVEDSMKEDDDACIESAFLGIMTSMASDHLRGQYPVSVRIETIAALTSAIVTSLVPAIISEKDGPKVLAAVPTRILFHPLTCSSVVMYPLICPYWCACSGRCNSSMNF